MEFRELVIWMLYITRGYSAPETTDALERAGVLAEKSGNPTRLVAQALGRILAPLFSGDLPVAGMLSDRALELALREGSPSVLAMAHAFQTITRYRRGDLAGADKYYEAGLAFFDDPGFRQVPGAGARARPDSSTPRYTSSGNAPALWTFAQAGYNAWLLGRTEVARERMARMVAAVDRNNPHNLTISGIATAEFQVYLREYKQAEALATQALELSEKHQLPIEAAFSRCVLGRARAELGRATEGIALIRQGIAGWLELGARLYIPADTASLAAAQALEGAVVDAIATVEEALQANPDLLAPRPEMLRLRGELRLKQGQTELAEAGFCEAIALAQKIGAKAWELRANDEPRAIIRQPRKACRGAHDTRRDLRLVHRRLRHRRLEGRQDAARRAERLSSRSRTMRCGKPR
jgi:tetratricopeptide (TPR) repeat protein